MKHMKKLVAFLMVVAMLAAAIPMVQVSAETAAAADIIEDEVLNNITYEEETGNGLAFRIQMNIRGAAMNARREFINTNAVATINGVDYKVIEMGAVLANRPEKILEGPDAMDREAVDAEKSIIDIPAKHLLDCAEDYCSFVVRVIRIPDAYTGTAVACRPYYVIEGADGNPQTIYSDSVDVASINQVYYSYNQEETPTLELTPGDVDNRLTASAVAEYCPSPLSPVYRESFKVTLTLQNVSANASTSAGDTVTYTFYNAAGDAIGTEEVQVDVLTPGESKDVTLYAPMGTATMVATDSNLNYIPTITLPAIGSDIDVTKKKNRIRVSAASASFNADGSIHVSLTFKNYTSNWITEETDYVKYTYYQGSVSKGTKTLYIGCIDTKSSKEKTFTFDVPSYTTKVKITSSKINYWTEWA